MESNSLKTVKQYLTFSDADRELQAAQERKIAYLCEKLGIKDTDYPYEYEVTQWGLKREIALGDLSKTVTAIYNEEKARMQSAQVRKPNTDA